ncbi:MAG: class I tRNA ligase family protein [Candidatus Gracilibacteria bacterium]|nr:class I tRNA ligase family protein [Candidatus Gracilibacteria bacterium]
MYKVSTKKLKVLILHGLGDTNQNNWHPWLKKELEKYGVEVFAPNLINPLEPILEDHLKQLEEYKDRIDENTIIIGHSLGCVTVLHFVDKFNLKPAKIINISPSFNKMNLEFSALSSEKIQKAKEPLKIYTNISIDYAKVTKNVGEIITYISEDDPFMDFKKVKEYYTSNFKNVSFREFKDKGHFNYKSGMLEIPLILDDILDNISVYTTRIDTVFGMTYAVIAPDQEKVNSFITEDNKVSCEKYISDSKKKSDLDRTELAKEKTGVFTGSYIINPYNGEKIPVYIGDYVLGNYGTGALMAVPAHDERDLEFAKKFNLKIRQSIAPLFEIKKGKDAIRPDKETITRDSIIAIVKHWNKDEYYCLDRGRLLWKSFVIGGVEKGETYEQAAIREIREETGYQNIKSIKEIGFEAHNLFFAEHKDVNRYAKCRGFFVELKDETFVEPKTEDIKNHAGKWLKKEEIEKYLNLDNHKYYWNIFQNIENAYTEDGVLINSSEFDGLTSEEARHKLTEYAEQKGFGCKKINYKLRDWLFSRQRYRGEPIPIIKCPKCGNVPVDEKELPLLLPEVENYEPTGTGESPLASITDWVNVKCPVCFGDAKRETNTMPQWAGSSWYFIRYIDPKNKNQIGDPKKLKNFMPVDIYFGGAEHTTVHLLYSRFWNKALYDFGVVPTSEPYTRRVQHGLIMGEDGRKMSKRWGNVINPDDVIEKYGADTMRTYVMFMGPYGESAAWSTSAINGMNRFMAKVYSLQEKTLIKVDDKETIKLLHKSIKKVSEDIEAVSYHTAISQLMILLNHVYLKKEISKDFLKIYIQLIAPFAPFLAEEMWHNLGEKNSVHVSSWPQYDNKLIIDEEMIIVVQINSKIRGEFVFSKDTPEELILINIKEKEQIKRWTEGKEITKEVYVPGKLVSIVVK